MKFLKHFDPWSGLVIAITLILFSIALITKGFTHDVLLEAGVFLVSVKLIIMSYKSSNSNQSIEQKLDELLLAVQRIERSHVHPGTLDLSPSNNGQPRSGAPDQTAPKVTS